MLLAYIRESNIYVKSAGDPLRGGGIGNRIQERARYCKNAASQVAERLDSV